MSDGVRTLRSEIAPFISALMVASLFLGLEYRTFVVLRPFDFVWLLSIATITQKMFETGRLPRFPTPPYILFFFFLLAYSAGNAYAQNSVGIALKEGIQGVQIALLFYALSISLSTARNQKAFLKYLFFLLLAIALVTAIYHIAVGSFGRFKLFDEPKLVFGVLATLGVSTALIGKKSTRSNWYAGFAVILMLSSGERKGWVAAISGISSILIMRVKRISFRGKLALFTVLFIISLTIAGSVAFLYNRVPSVEKQFGSLADIYYYTTDSDFTYEDASTVSNRSRLFLIENAIRLMKENMWFGIGIENFRSILEATSTEDENLVHGVHNEYLRYAAEGGITGFSLYLFSWLSLFYAAHASGKSGRRQTDSVFGRTLALIYYGAVVNIFLAGGILNVIFFILPAALLCNIEQKSNRPNRGHSGRT